MAHGHSLVALYGLAGISLGKGATGEFLKAFRSAKKGGGAVGPAGIGIIDGAKFRSQLFPGFTKVGLFGVQAQRFNASLGSIVAFARRRQGRVACVIKENHQQAEGQQEKHWRGKTSDAVPGLTGRRTLPLRAVRRRILGRPRRRASGLRPGLCRALSRGWVFFAGHGCSLRLLVRVCHFSDRLLMFPCAFVASRLGMRVCSRKLPLPRRHILHNICQKRLRCKKTWHGVASRATPVITYGQSCVLFLKAFAPCVGLNTFLLKALRRLCALALP